MFEVEVCVKIPSPRLPQNPDPRLAQIPDPRLLLGFPKSQILGYSSVFPNPRSSVTMGMFCVPDPRLLLGFPKSQILGYSKSQILGNYEHVLCPRSSVTGSCLRYGHVLCPRSPQIPDPRLPQIPDPRLLLGFPKSQILGNWELPKK